MNMSDRAVAEATEDVLGRWGLAKTIFNLIATSRSNSAVRVGIYGGWGEGKTSVLRFVEGLAVKNGIHVCWFSVWSAQTQADLWAGLFDALQSVPQPASPPPSGRWEQAKALFTNTADKTARKTEKIAELHPYAKAVNTLAKLAAKRGSEDIERMIAGLGAGARVLILVDDVDRVESALIPKLLMGLHDLFEELGQCAVVIALDPASVSGGLSQVNPAWSSAPAFLEKIVQYPFRLPRPTDDQLKRLVIESVRESKLSVPEQAFVDLLELLPPNPRKVKQFIRSLQRIQPTLARLANDEWNPTLLLVIELLRSVSAEAAEELLEDEAFVGEWVLANFMTKKEEMHEGGKITKVQYARIEAAVAKATPRASDEERDQLTRRLTAITAGSMERLSFVGKEVAIGHARLDQEPPVMTLREFDTLIRSWSADRSSAKLHSLLEEHAAAQERSQREIVEASTLALLSRRGELIGSASEVFGSGDAQVLIEKIETHSLLLEQLITDHKVLADIRVPSRVEIFLTMRTQTAQFINRLSDPPYASARQNLREQLFRASVFLRDSAADVLKALEPWNRMTDGRNVAGEAELKDTRERLETIFAEFLCDGVLERFRRVGGVAAVGDFLKNRAEVWLMYYPGTVFHQPACRSRLLAIAQEADEVVAQNFFVYLRTLVGKEGLTESRVLAADASLVVPAWGAASKVRPQPKMRGYVIELVTRLRETLKDEGAIEMPQWVDSVQEEGSATSAANPGQADAAPPS